MKTFAAVLVLLALFALSDRSLAAAKAAPASPAGGHAALFLSKGLASPFLVDRCPPICLDPDCNCVIYGFWAGGQCIYQQFCTEM